MSQWDGMERRRHAISVAEPPASMEVMAPENQGSIAVNSLDLSDSISLALAQAGLSKKQACAHMDGLDPGLWHRQLTGDGHVSFQRLLKLPIAFWQCFIPIIAQAAGLVVVRADEVGQFVIRVNVEQRRRA